MINVHFCSNASFKNAHPQSGTSKLFLVLFIFFVVQILSWLEYAHAHTHAKLPSRNKCTTNWLKIWNLQLPPLLLLKICICFAICRDFSIQIEFLHSYDYHFDDILRRKKKSIPIAFAAVLVDFAVNKSCCASQFHIFNSIVSEKKKKTFSSILFVFVMEWMRSKCRKKY